MADGISTYTAGQAVKLRFYELAPTILTATSGVLITYGHPGAERADDIVFFGPVRVVQVPGPMSRTQRLRDETIELDVTISSYRGGGWEAELEADEGAAGLLQTLEYYVRQTNTELKPVGGGNGAVRWCFLDRWEAQPFTVVDDARIAVGRNVTIEATFTASVRIDGTT